MRIEHEGGAAAWAAGTPDPQRAWAASATGAMVLSESFFKSLVADNQKTPLAVLSL